LFSKLDKRDNPEAILIPQRGIFFRKVFQRRQVKYAHFAAGRKAKEPP
jgi:hypothetical protein